MLSKLVCDWGRMSWGFETDPEYQELLDWADSFVRHEVELLGSLGISNEMPFSRWMVSAEALALADGPTETHKVVVARQVLREYQPHDGL